MRVVICDPGEVYRMSLIEMVNRWADKHNNVSVQTILFVSSEDLLEAIQHGQTYDIIFLACIFPNELNGLELAHIVRSYDEHTQIVLLSDCMKYAIQGYAVNALRYLCKPVFPNQLFECLDITYNQWFSSATEKIVLYGKGKRVTLWCMKDILYIESRGNEIMIYRTVCNEPFTLRMSLCHMLNLLPSNGFVRCHNSYIVNLRYAKSISPTIITLANGQDIPVGNKYRKLIKGIMDMY